MKKPNDMRVLVVIDHGFADAEFRLARLGLERSGASITVAGPVAGEAYQSDSGRAVTADTAIRDVRAEDFDALILPGFASLQGMRSDAGAIELIQSFDRARKVIGFIGRGATAAIEAGVVRERHCTSAGAWKESMIDARAIWSDAPMVRDGTIVSSRGLADGPAFMEGLMEALSPRSPRPRISPGPPPPRRSATG